MRPACPSLTTTADRRGAASPASAPATAPGDEKPHGQPRRVLLLGNPRARHGAGAGALADRLARLGPEVTFAEPDGLDALDRTIRGIGAEADRIVIAGGDGTISAALPALLDVRTPLAVLPLGTANDLARNLDLPAAIDDQLALAAGGQVVLIDIGLVNGRPFLNAASIGLGAAVAALHQGDAKRWLGVLNYLRVLYLAYRRSRPFTVTITCDGATHRDRFVHVAVVNGRFHGGGLEPTPSSSIADGTLDLYALKGGPAFQLMRVLAALRIRGAASDRLFRLRGRELTLTTSRPRRVNVDGELTLRTPLEIGILQRALSIVVPTS